MRWHVSFEVEARNKMDAEREGARVLNGSGHTVVRVQSLPSVMVEDEEEAVNARNLRLFGKLDGRCRL